MPRPFSRLNREFAPELAQHSRLVKNGCGVVLTVNSIQLAYSRELGDAIAHGRHAQTDLVGRDRVVPIKNFP